jgi:hypothetical protein
MRISLASMREAAIIHGRLVSFRIAIAGGIDGAAIRFRLAALYLRWRRWKEARGQVAAGFKTMMRWRHAGELSA